jgi:aspartyl-tRNA(Asn)/glutamyl-tRNA(Gln) amidotransferase subunit A
MRRSILQLSEVLRAGSLSPVELTEKCLARIEKLNPALNAFVTVTADSALAQAHQAERDISQGKWRGPLHGIPLGLKDLIDTAGTRTTAASALFKDRIPAEDAEVVLRLKAAGAVLLGKQNLHEFAYGGSSLISYFGEVHNPWNADHIAGGSSGGSAAAVATGMGYGAIGTDTAGSVREPAALCGVVGLKPTYGRVNARGVIPLSPSLDHIGPITRFVADAAVMLQAIAEAGQGGSGTVAPDYAAALNHPCQTLRIGVPRSFFYEELDPEVASSAEEALTVLKSMGHELMDISLSMDTDRTLQAAESYLAHVDFLAVNPELYQAETLRRIRGGAVEWPDYTRALLKLKSERRKIGRIFSQVDALATPTMPVPAPNIAELREHPELLRPHELLLLRNTRPFNVWGLPAISVPCGFTKAGLPIGLQIAGPHWREDVVLCLAQAFEQATDWHQREPDVQRLLH